MMMVLSIGLLSLLNSSMTFAMDRDINGMYADLMESIGDTKSMGMAVRPIIAKQVVRMAVAEDTIPLFREYVEVYDLGREHLRMAKLERCYNTFDKFVLAALRDSVLSMKRLDKKFDPSIFGRIEAQDQDAKSIRDFLKDYLKRSR